MVTPTDPLYSSQWHFDFLGDIETIWNEYSGAGVNIGIYDDGVDYNHEDLDDNYDDSLHAIGPGGPLDPFPVNFVPGPFPNSDLHGTAVAGLIAGELNGTGGVGVAWGTTISGVNIFGGGYGSVNGDQAAFMDVAGQAAANFDISQNSWGATPNFNAFQNLNIAGSFAFDLNAVYSDISATGRGGLGTIITQAAGNDNMDANGDGTNANRFTITVAATIADGFAASYSNFGAAILITAPAAEVTTDLSGAAGDNPTNYLNNFGGTSAATPVVSGVIALMLQANSGLGWRDVQSILTASATLTGSALDAAGPGANEEGVWAINGASNWNGGGMHIHTNYGYGMVNAYNAVRMAEVWSLLYPTAATSANEQEVSASIAIDPVVATGAVQSFEIEITDDILMEHVQLFLDYDTTYAGDLDLVLISPDGTRIQVALGDGFGPSADIIGGWYFGIEGLRGEMSAGTWTIEFSDVFTGSDAITVSGASLNIYGSAATTNTVHHITDEFLTLLANDPTRAIVDTDGGLADWLNLSAVAGDIDVSLDGGLFVDQVYWAGTANTGIERIITGDGNDTLYGDGVANRLYGMRGNDLFYGGGGGDRIFGGTGRDSLFGELGSDSLDGGSSSDLLDGGLGLDTLYGGAGGDSLYGGDGNDRLFGDTGSDYLEAGTGDDWLDGATGGDTLFGGDGNDSLFGGSAGDELYGGVNNDSITGGSGRDSLYGDGNNDTINGGSDDDYVVGGSGDDSLLGSSGTDTVIGGSGNDTIIGNSGADLLTGNSGVDHFVYNAASESGPGALRDTITDLAHGQDRIDLRLIDANPFLANDQAFSFIGAAAFGGLGAASAGQLRFTANSATTATIEMDINGDGVADMSIYLSSTNFVVVGDFFL